MGVSPAWAKADAAAARAIAARYRGAPILVGLAGAQGSGKSTMAPRLARRLEKTGLRTAVLALDDFYLTRLEREELARTVHPLLATRGVPGTHDVALLTRVIDALLTGSSARVPRFDKAADDRAREGREIAGPVDVLLLEGWCIGARAQPAAALARPVNDLERREDAGGRWRRWVNDRLATDYAGLFEHLALRILLRAPDFAVVLGWRSEQERGLLSGGMEPPAIERFIGHYERITRWMLEDETADLVIDLGPDREPSLRV